MFLKPTHSEEVGEIIASLKNKATLDTKITALKSAGKSTSFTGTIATLVNNSFMQGCFPEALKTARVVPIHKGGTKSDVANYRPISLLSTFSKIYEKLMHTRLI
jgi:Notch-like protein